MAIEADHYREHREALKADPIIQQMTRDLAGVVQAGIVDVDSWSFMRAAMNEYRRRGGTIPAHIGGPAEAIRALLA
jgi:hypothetical protein